jgi:hypothetical protein
MINKKKKKKIYRYLIIIIIIIIVTGTKLDFVVILARIKLNLSVLKCFI